MSRVTVLDYGSGNIRSAVRALERLGADVELSADPDEAIGADGLVVPGVGAFAACMAGLREVQAERILTERIQAGRPVLGICVGMQVLFSAGIEHGVETPGLDLLPGRVEQLNAPVIPHMGWNTVRPPAGSVLFDGVGEDTRFYFVHSYAVHPGAGQGRYAATLAEHGEDFVAAVEAGPLSATQFHPEKSGDAGAQLLANWLGSL
ncbi:imidazole glycerol phosphate synthase subunit HisH [Jatrophihabitans sp.]|jgi:glutamine amidotransferase|uniref:imidazole glycerol phosphate synthase subunit HisH n=1 Tax=Jatrophihabitans sp. TaxID=1932789 RepID=UPI002F0D07D7